MSTSYRAPARPAAAATLAIEQVYRGRWFDGSVWIADG